MIPSDDELAEIERMTRLNDPHFDGKYNRTLRLRVLAILSAWHRRRGQPEFFTVQELARRARGTETSASSAVRDLRKKKNGGFTVVRRRLEGGLSDYMMLPDQQRKLFYQP